MALLARSSALRFLLLGPAGLAAACGDTKSDAGAGADSGPPDGGARTELVVHYHRPDRAYAGWKAAVSGDTTAAMIESSAPDGFGAVYRVPLKKDARNISVHFEM